MLRANRIRGTVWVVFCLLFKLLIAQPTFEWQENRIYSYRLTVNAQQQVSFEQIARLMDKTLHHTPRPEYKYDYTLQSELVIAPIQRVEQDWLLVLQLVSPQIVLSIGEGTPKSVDASLLQQQLGETTLYLRYSAAGEIRSLWFTPKESIDASNILRAIVARLQLRLPLPPSNRWISEEEAPEGRFLAEYEIVRQSNMQYDIQKRRLKYQQTERVVFFPQNLIPEDSISIELRDGVIYRMEARFHTRSLVNNEVIGSETTNLKLELKEIRPADTKHIEAWRTRHRSIAHAPERLYNPNRTLTTAQQRLIDQQTLGNDTLETLQQKLRLLEPNAPFEQVADLIPAWTALIRLQPSLCNDLVPKVAELNLREPQAQVLISALREAGHPQAQSALAHLARLYYQRNDAVAYALLIPNIALLKSPTETTEATLRELAISNDADFAYPARLAIGSVGYHLRETNPMRAYQLSDWIVQQLKRSSNDSEREVWLLALGNLGLNDTLPTIQAYLNSPNENLRTAATGALRFLTLSGTESLLLERLRTDNSRLVKQEAISAFQYRTPSSAALQLLREYLQQETDKQLRRALLDSLYTQATKNSAIVELLRWAAQNDADQEIRLYAESLVVSLK